MILDNRVAFVLGAVEIMFSCWLRVASGQTTVGWLSPASGQWTSGANWSGGNVPNNGSPTGATYNAVIDAVGSSYTVNLNAPNTVVNSILVNSANAYLYLNGGTLRSLNGIMINAGTLSMGSPVFNGATLNMTSVTSIGGTMGIGYGSVLDAVTLDADATVFGGTSMTIRNGLTLGKGRTLSIQAPTVSSTQVVFAGGPQVVSGGTVVFDGSPSDSAIAFNQTSTALTIAPGTIIRTGTAGAVVGNNGDFTNQGTISAQTVGRSLTMRGSNWRNEGLLKADGGALILAGMIAPGGLGTISSVNNGSISLTGTLNNAGTTTLLDGSDRLLRLSGNSSGGTVVGGTLATANGGQFQVGSSIPKLIDVTLDTNLIVGVGQTIDANGTLTVAQGRSISVSGASGAGSTALRFVGPGATRLAGNGEVVFNSTVQGSEFAPYNAIQPTGGTTSFTIDPGMTIRTGNDSGTIGSSGIQLTNKGTIISNVPGRTVSLSGTNIRNEGTIQLDGGKLLLAGTVAPGGLGTITGTGVSDILLQTGATFNNDGSEIELGGDSPMRLRLRGTFQGGSVYTNDSDPVGRGNSGRARDGAGWITSKEELGKLKRVYAIGYSPSGNGLAAGLSNGQSRSTTDVIIDDIAWMYLTSSANITIEEGLTLGDVTIVLDSTSSNGGLQFVGTQSINAGLGRPPVGKTPRPARGTIVFEGSGGSQRFYVSGGTLNIGQGISLVTGDGNGNINLLSSASLVNNGLISARTVGRKVDIVGSSANTSFTNGVSGILEATGGAVLNIGSLTPTLNPPWSSTGTIRAGAGGVVNVLRNGYVMTAQGTTQFEFAGTGAGQFGQIVVSGGVTLSGTLELQLGEEFIPAWGNQWTVLTATMPLVGAFSSVTRDVPTSPNLRWWGESVGNTLRVGVRHVADFNHDGAVNTIDLTTFLGQFGQSGPGLVADMDGNGSVNTQDLTRFLGAFGLAATP